MTWPVHTPSNRRAKTGRTIQQRVYSELRDGVCKASDIADALRLPPTCVRAALWSLRQAGIVTKVGKTKHAIYRLVPGARMPLDTRGQHPASRKNLVPGDPVELAERHKRWRESGGMPTFVPLNPLVKLSKLWRPQCTR